MGKKRRRYITLSIILTIGFLTIGVCCCTKSYLRLWETLGELCAALKFYFCELFGIEQNLAPNEPVIPPSEVLNGELNLLPTNSNVFLLKLETYFALLINGTHLGLYFTNIGTWLGDFAKVLLMVFPVIIVLIICIKKLYDKPNTKHNQDTLPLRVFKCLGGTMYQPIKKFVLAYRQFLEENSRWKTLWIWIWLGNLNFLSILVAFFAYYFYFAISFDIASLYPQVVTLLKDILLVLKFFPWFLTGTIAWLIFKYIRENIGEQILQHHEARNCGFIKELPIVTMTCGSMGKKKTTLTTDMALSQTVMFRQEAFQRLQKQDMKFPFFPWICFEKEIQKCMKYGRIYNLASIHTWIDLKRKRYEKHGNINWQLYGYDVGRYGLSYENGLKTEDIFDVLETYAKLYFIYVIESSLLISNYSIRVEDILYDSGNFPMRAYSFFTPAVENTRFAHILDFDVLRLGKKVIENNPKAGSFEFGVVVITEVGKERANNLELKEIKKSANEANQKNDLFNAWLKMCRHSATVDDFPFIKVFTDEQRPESWGADSRDLADILTITNSGKQKLALPFYTIEAMLCDWAFSRFIALYYDFRYKRGDNTLLVYLLKIIVSKIWARNERIYNRFGYSVLNIEKERGTQDSKPEKKRYFLSNYKIYRERFTTDCFSDYFNDLALKSGIGLMDYLTYKMVRASVDELKAQNSYFIRDLYGK